MEERVQPSYHHQNSKSSPSTSEDNPTPRQSAPESQNIRPLFRAGTYIVQVPKDQVFRVPPPDNGRRMLENQPQQNGRRCCCSSCLCLCMLVIAIVVVAGIVGVVIFLTPDDPGFHIEHVMFKNPPPVFDIKLKVKNSNGYKEISYDRTGSNVNLSFKRKEIADGKFPSFDQDPKNTTILGVVLHGSNLPTEILTSVNSTKSKTHIPLSLSMNIPVQFKVKGQNIKHKRIDVSCSFTVDRLDKDTKILDQHWGTN